MIFILTWLTQSHQYICSDKQLRWND